MQSNTTTRVTITATQETRPVEYVVTADMIVVDRHGIPHVVKAGITITLPEPVGPVKLTAEPL